MRKTMLTFATAALVIMLPMAAAAGGNHGGGDTSACSGFAEGTEIAMLDSCFEGTAHLAPVGSTIVVRNEGELPHTFTAVDGSFDTGQVQPGETFEVTVEEPGVYRVFCALHGTAEGDGMAGVLIAGEPKELAVSTPANLDLLTGAVAEGNQDMESAIESQRAMLAALTSSFAKMTEAMEQPPPATDETTPPGPVVEVETGPGWVIALAGAALALGAVAMAAVLIERRERHREDGRAVGVPQLDT